jgi:gliding motility-associated-like protein
MKNLYTKCFKLIFVCFLLLSFSSYSQNTGNSWNAKFDYSKAFIENLGQFNNTKITEPVLFAVDNGSTMIYFTKKGITYSFLKRWPKMTPEEKKIRKQNRKTLNDWKQLEIDEKIMDYNTDVVSFNFLEANPKVKIITYDQTSDYHNYNVKQKDGSFKTINKIKAYRKVTYKSIYPNIDIEFICHPDNGIKYSIILLPGADITKVKMTYKGIPVLAENGDVKIKTIFGDITDHAPVAFLQENKNVVVPSKFILNNNIISFEIGQYDNSKTLIIDPWVQMPVMSNSNGVWECERDGAGNVYIIGGDMPMKLIKYNAAGAIQWTYNTPWDTANYWLGTFATDLAGNSFVTSGSIANLQKVNTAGSVDWTYNAPLLSSDEYWNIAFNCDQTKLIVGGTSGTMFQIQGAIFDINTSNGSVNSTQIVGTGNMFSFPPAIQEVRSISSCRNARYYFLTLDTIGCIDENFTGCGSTSPVIFRENSGYALGYKCEDYRPNNGNGCIMAIRANRYFVYTQNGTDVQKRSLVDGSIISSAPIPGGLSSSMFGRFQVGNSGLDLDTCGNVYVGSGNAIIKYDENLNLITSISTPYKVSDVSVSANGNVIFCGTTGTNANTSRTGYIQSADMSACNPLSIYCCDANICPSGPYCNTDPAVNLIAATPGGTWSGPGITDPSAGTFDPAVAGPGLFNIVYTLSCGSDSTSILVNDCGGCPTITITISNIIDIACGVPTGSFTAECSGGADPYLFVLVNSSGGIVTSFTNITGPQNFTGLTADTYTLNIADADTCPSSVTVTINQSNNLSITLTPQDEGCPGSCTGQITSTVAGSTGPFTYNWSNSEATANISNLCAGSYNVTISETAGVCTGTATATINSSQGLQLTVVSTSPDICGQGNGSGTIAISGGSGNYTYIWNTVPPQSSSTIINVISGTYSVSVTDVTNPSCHLTGNIQIPTAGSLTLATTFEDENCRQQNGSATVSVVGTYTGQFNYQWSTSPSDTTDSISGLAAGIYYVTVSTGNCTATTSVLVNNIPGPEAAFMAHPTPTTLLDPVVFFTDQTFPYATQWYWSFGDDSTSCLQNPSHYYDDIDSFLVRLIILNDQGCTDTAYRTIYINDYFTFYVPNAFTPNGDGKNEIFIPYGNPNCISADDYSMYIYDRWGKLMFTTTDINQGWNGRMNNEGDLTTVVTGIYTYVIFVKDTENIKHVYKGIVTVYQ